MLSFLRKHKLARVAVYLVFALMILAALSSYFGLAAKICEENAAKDYRECTSHNLVFVLLWHIAEFTNWLSPAITALATAAVAWFTLTLWITGTEQARLTQESIGLARDEFLSSHRPELRIHSIKLVRPETDQGPITAEFHIINSGTADCIVTGSAVLLEYQYWIDLENLPDLPPNDVIPCGRIKVGATRKVEVSSDDLGALHFVNAPAPSAYVVVTFPPSPEKALYFYGWVAYEELSKNVRTTFFLRKYEPARERFAPFPVDDPEANCTY